MKCPKCEYEFRAMDADEKFVHQALENWQSDIYDSWNHDNAYGFEVWNHVEVGESKDVEKLGTVKLVEKNFKYEFDYGVNPVFVVLEVNGSFYRKDGSRDSYGEFDFKDGDFRRVVRQEKSVWVWEA